MPTATVNRFDGGKVGDLRWSPAFRQPFNKFASATNFDIRTYPHRLKPLVGMETALGSDIGDLTPYNLRSFLNLEYTAGTARLFALGNETGQTYWRLLISNSGSFPSNWTTITNGVGTTGTVIYNSLQSYNTAGVGALYLKYVSSADIKVARFVPSTTTKTDALGTIANGTASFTGAVYPQPYVFDNEGLNGVIYFAAWNKLAKYDGASTTFTDISTADSVYLPSNFISTSLSEYLDFLAIACRDTNFAQNSRVYLWDRNVTNTLFAQIIDWGDGQLNVLDNIDGTLIGISEINGTAFRNNPRLVIKKWEGGQPEVIAEIPGLDNTANSLKNFKAKSNNQLYFVASFNSVYKTFVVGKNAIGQWYVSEANTINNDTTVTVVGGMSVTNDIVWVQHGSSGAVNRTDDNSALTLATSEMTTVYNPGMIEEHKYKQKNLTAVQVNFAPMPVGSQIVLKYSVDGGAFQTAVTRSYIASPTDSSDTATSFERTQFATGGQFDSGREYQFRIESTGGAEPTSLKYKYELFDTLL